MIFSNILYEKMQAFGALSRSMRVARVLRKPSPSIISSSQLEQCTSEDASVLSPTMPICRRLSSAIFSGITRGYSYHSKLSYLKNNFPVRRSILFSSQSSAIDNDLSGELRVKGIYENMVTCVSVKRTAPPNTWLWSFVAKCSTNEDIKLLFDILQRLRTFRLSNLRISDNFNSALCREVTKSCIRVGAIEFGKKALWKHNLYGLTPDIGSVNHLLLHAKQQNDVKLMIEVMNLVKKNKLPLQPGTADIVFSICYGTKRSDLISKYGKRFVKSGVKLRQTSFDLWMEFTARIGDTESLWKIEKWRSETMKEHSLSTGFSCAKGFLVDHKPESAAALIQIINQNIPRRPDIEVEIHKLVSEWPLEVIKHQKEENRKAFAAALRSDITSLINALPSLGVEAHIFIEELTRKDGV